MEESLYKQVEDCVKIFLDKQNILNYKIKIKFDSDKATHFISDIARIEVETKDTNLDLFVKFAKTQEECRRRVAVRECFKNETYIYGFVLPVFKQFQEEQKIVDQFKSYPNFCASSDKELKETIVLENIIVKGFETYKSVTLDYDHVLLLIKEVARFHALSFAIRDQRPNIFDQFKNFIKDYEFRGPCGENNNELLTYFFPTCLQTLDPIKDKVVLNRFKIFEKFFFKRLQEATEVNAAEPYSVVTHSDLWVSNLLFKYDELKQPSELCLVDWQQIKLSSPVSDISEIMFVCLDKEARDKHYSNLIQEYYSSFSLFLKQLGSDPDILFPFDVLQEHLKKFSIHGLHTAVRMVSFTSIAKDEIPDLSEEGAFKFVCTAKKEPKLFNKRMRDILLDYANYGYDL